MSWWTSTLLKIPQPNSALFGGVPPSFFSQCGTGSPMITPQTRFQHLRIQILWSLSALAQLCPSASQALTASDRWFGINGECTLGRRQRIIYPVAHLKAAEGEIRSPIQTLLNWQVVWARIANKAFGMGDFYSYDMVGIYPCGTRNVLVGKPL